MAHNSINEALELTLENKSFATLVNSESTFFVIRNLDVTKKYNARIKVENNDSRVNLAVYDSNIGIVRHVNEYKQYHVFNLSKEKNTYYIRVSGEDYANAGGTSVSVQVTYDNNSLLAERLNLDVTDYLDICVGQAWRLVSWIPMDTLEAQGFKPVLTSLAPSVATIRNEDVIGVSPGTARVRYRSAYSEVEDILEVRVVAKPHFEGKGTAENPFKIYTAQDFYNIRFYLTDAVTFVLENDIDLTGYEQWRPIGDIGTGFNGRLYGMGHTIRGAKRTTMFNYSGKNVGLFSYIHGGHVYDLNIEDCDLTCKDNGHIGMLAGCLRGAIIRNVTVRNSQILDCFIYSGGLAGTSYGGTTNNYIQECGIENARLIGNTAGGLIGRAYSDVYADDCFANVTLGHKFKYVGGSYGGILGIGASATLNKCLAVVDIAHDASINDVSDIKIGAIAGEFRVGDESKYHQVVGTVIAPGATNSVGQVTLAEMMSKDTYRGDWDFDTIWEWNEGQHPTFMPVKFMTIHHYSSIGNELPYNYYGYDATFQVRTVLRNQIWKVPLKGNPEASFSRKGYVTKRYALLTDTVDGMLNVQLEKYNYHNQQTYTISTFEDFQKIKDDLYGKYILTNDVDFEGQPMEPAMNSRNEGFMGDFDGQGYTIKNLFLCQTSEESKLNGLSLFGHTYNARFRNVNFEDCRIQDDISDNIGLLTSSLQHVIVEDDTAAEEWHYPQIYNCTAKRLTYDLNVSTSGNIGSFVGTIETYVTRFSSFSDPFVKDVTVRDFVVNVNSDASYIGGFAGYIDSLYHSINEEGMWDEYSNYQPAGFDMDNIDTELIINAVDDTVNISSIGGIAGVNSVTRPQLLNRLGAKLTINNGIISDVGGMFGDSYNYSPVSYENWYADVDISGVAIENVGTGIGGFASYIDFYPDYDGDMLQLKKGYIAMKNDLAENVDSESRGMVFGSPDFTSDTQVIVEGIYVDETINGMAQASSQASYVTLLPTEEMYKRGTFDQWDFEEIWQIREGVDYPRFRIAVTETQCTAIPLRQLTIN